jgi:DNA-binding LacI/PurR family transcriptional regulator
MHHTAEFGIAAHWKYKEGITEKNEKMEERLAWVRQILESQSTTDDATDIVRSIKVDLSQEDVFAVTPMGDVINLPVGATVVDFAFAIHSAVGTRMVGAKVDGIIVLGQLEENYVKELFNLNIPVVFLDFYSSDSRTDTILSDSFFGSYMLTNHLIANGHRNIGFLGSINSTSSIQDRYLGYYKALLEKNILVNSEWIIEDRGPDGTGYPSYKLPAEMPTAFVCNCDEAVYILLNQLKAEGYSVPDDISVVGYDNHIYSTIANPRITTIDVDSKRMSAEAVETIIKKIRDRNYSRGRTLVTGKIIYRDSVKAIKK